MIQTSIGQSCHHPIANSTGPATALRRKNGTSYDGTTALNSSSLRPMRRSGVFKYSARLSSRAAMRRRGLGIADVRLPIPDWPAGAVAGLGEASVSASNRVSSGRHTVTNEHRGHLGELRSGEGMVPAAVAE